MKRLAHVFEDAWKGGKKCEVVYLLGLQDQGKDPGSNGCSTGYLREMYPVLTVTFKTHTHVNSGWKGAAAKRHQGRDD